MNNTEKKFVQLCLVQLCLALECGHLNVEKGGREKTEIRVGK
jgi:hypothetical protein